MQVRFRLSPSIGAQTSASSSSMLGSALGTRNAAFVRGLASDNVAAMSDDDLNELIFQ